MKSMFGVAVIGAASLVGAYQGASAADLPAKTPAPTPDVSPTAFFLFQDNQISYRFEPNAKEPGVIRPGGAFPKGPAQPIQKNIAALTHVDAWKYGTNFFNVDFLSSNSADPEAASGPAATPFTAQGALEIYALYRGTISGNAVTNSHQFSYGFVKDVSLGFGGDINTKDTFFGPRKRDLVAGPQIAFDVPGFLTIEANVYKEWNRNMDANPGTSTYADFRPTAEFEVTYLQPLTFTGLPLSFSGFLNVVLPKGDGHIQAFPNNDTRTELLTANRITLDIGKLLAHREHLVDIFVGYKYWYNKFGNNHVNLSGSIESTVFAGVALHSF